MNLNVPKTDSNGQDKFHQKFESMPKPTAVTAASSNSDQNTTLQHPKDKQQEQQVNKLLHSNEDTNFIKDNNKTQQQDTTTRSTAKWTTIHKPRRANSTKPSGSEPRTG